MEEDWISCQYYSLTPGQERGLQGFFPKITTGKTISKE
jgi:hypothetical protein